MTKPDTEKFKKPDQEINPAKHAEKNGEETDSTDKNLKTAEAKLTIAKKKLGECQVGIKELEKIHVIPKDFNLALENEKSQKVANEGLDLAIKLGKSKEEIEGLEKEIKHLKEKQKEPYTYETFNRETEALSLAISDALQKFGNVLQNKEGDRSQAQKAIDEIDPNLPDFQRLRAQLDTEKITAENKIRAHQPKFGTRGETLVDEANRKRAEVKEKHERVYNQMKRDIIRKYGEQH